MSQYHDTAPLFVLETYTDEQGQILAWYEVVGCSGFSCWEYVYCDVEDYRQGIES